MDERSLGADAVRTLDDIRKLPFTVKTDLRDTYPFGLFASPMQEIVRLHASSGTTGKPIVVAYTQEDIDVWTSVMVRSLAACGLHRGDIIQNAYGYGLFTGGLGAHYGGEGLGATVIPISGGNTDRQIMVMKDFGVTAICCTPSYFLHLIERAGELGVDMKKLPLRAGVFGAEPWTEAMRQRIEADSSLKAYDIYGLSEIIGPGVAIECQTPERPARLRGPLLPRDHRPLDRRGPARGRRGRTRPDDPLEAGHADDPLPHPRHHQPRARAVPVRPDDPPHAPHRPPQRRHVHHPRHQRLPVAGRGGAAGRRGHPAPLPDRPDARARAWTRWKCRSRSPPEFFTDKVRSLEALQARLVQTLDSTLGLRVDVRLVEPHTIERSQGKAKRVLDQRNLGA